MKSMIKSIQKVIKVGSSAAVTIPAKDVKRLGISYGDEIKVSFEVTKKADTDPEKVELIKVTQRLIERHKKALKNLSQR